MGERVADDVGRVFTGVRRRFPVVRRERSTDLHRRDFDEAGGGFLVSEQRRDFAAKILVSAYTFQKRQALAFRAPER